MSEAEPVPTGTTSATTADEAQVSKEPSASDATLSAVSTAPSQPVSAPSDVPAPSASYSEPPASHPPTVPPVPIPEQQQQQHIPAPETQPGHPPLAHSQPPIDALNPAPVHVPDSSHTAHQQPQQQSQGPVSMGMAASPPISMQGPTIAQYYPDMLGRISSPDGYDLMDSGRLISGRSKKEKDVKRRTKTGCLTCRKRRIKCDERHPVCRNCEKSKRDCLGYDPVFRSQPGTSAIQPAPSQPGHLVAPQAQAVDAPPLPHNQPPAASSYSPPLPDTSASSTSPALDQSDYTTNNQIGQPADKNTSPPTVSVQDTTAPPETSPMAATLDMADKLELRKVDVEELLAVRGQLCQPLEPINTTPDRIEDIKLLFMSYAVGIDKFLECSWYDTKAMPHMLANGRLLAQYSALLEGFNDPQIHEPTFLARLESRETRIIWDTMALSRAAHDQNTSKDADPSTPPDPELLYAVKRLSVFETLVTGETLEHNPVSFEDPVEGDSALQLSGLSGQIKGRELQFWESIGHYLTITDKQPECKKKRASVLMTTRALLDSFENRDIIYSMAIVRDIAKYQPRKLKPLVGATDEKEAGAKLYVACKFLEDESQGKGTNQAVKRLSGMVTQHWDQPPYSI